MKTDETLSQGQLQYVDILLERRPREGTSGPEVGVGEGWTCHDYNGPLGSSEGSMTHKIIFIIA